MKAIIKIYQIKDVANTPYAFRGWMDHKDPFTPNMEDYEKVIEFPYDEGKTVVDILDTVFELGNHGAFQQMVPEVKMRSVSVSDIIEVNGMRWYVDTMGFTAIEKVEA